MMTTPGRSGYPNKPFESISEARQWVHRFVQWYNPEHRHSAIRYVTPNQRRSSQEHSVLPQREAVYEAAKQRNPGRWPGRSRNWNPLTEVWLNPPKEHQAEKRQNLKAA